jgi:hypothetical protein
MAPPRDAAARDRPAASGSEVEPFDDHAARLFGQVHPEQPAVLPAHETVALHFVTSGCADRETLIVEFASNGARNYQRPVASVIRFRATF